MAAATRENKNDSLKSHAEGGNTNNKKIERRIAGERYTRQQESYNGYVS